MIWRFLKNESGATAIEYGLIAGLIAVAIASGFSQLANQLQTLWGDNNSDIQQGLNKN
ncbi:Flp family type IVb pilin [Aminobacter sp. BE322]|uniref:Flp family type IVb pilin n=1 Tax=unclassified Aminobacter TaxID=2644704 RepID=UPI003D1F578B